MSLVVRKNTKGKQLLVAALRAMGVLGVADLSRFARVWWQGRADNAAFLAQNPGFARPPAYRMYEAYSYTSYRAYVASGIETAAFIQRLFEQHSTVAQPKIAEWGCGLARILAPLRRTTGWEISGFDYNPDSIAWCQANVPGAAFFTNALDPPLPSPDNVFDGSYCISVFTHLSEDLQLAWIAELRRVLKPGGILIASFHSTNVAGRLLDGEAATFQAGALVVRGNVREGGRLFAAYHPPRFIADTLLSGFDILEIIENPLSSMVQTVYVARRRGEAG